MQNAVVKITIKFCIFIFFKHQKNRSFVNTPILDAPQIEAISKGLHGDPFSVLGMHIAQIDGSKVIVVRAILPNASDVYVEYEEDDKRLQMTRISDDGLYEAVFEGHNEPFDYQFWVVQDQAENYRMIDPYSFDLLIDDFKLQLWGEGNYQKAYELMGSHPKEINGVEGVHFVVSAPSAQRVSVVGSFNDWDGRRNPMRKYHEQGLWELFIPGIQPGDTYKYEIKTFNDDWPLLKADPYGFYSELRPATASIVHDFSDYEWNDQKWMQKRVDKQSLDAPVSIYEIHFGSWKRKGERGEEFLSYRDMAEELIPYLNEIGFTHVEMMPIAEHPYDPSWGYQITGYFAPTSRYGEPEDLMYFIDECHKNDIGVLIDWVPAHFTKDDHGLRRFDGTALYEHEDPRQGEHSDWGTLIFNYGRTEVINFLISNAVYWLDKFHIDGLRVDAVASMVYLDYSREDGEWIPNRYGGKENIEAIQFLKKVNDIIHTLYPGAITAAEESTSFPAVSKPTKDGGLGFDYKWNMGWMNDTLTYIEKDPIYRKYHQDQLTFSLIYAFSEHFILPFSHDEVVHMKQSMIAKMPGDDWQKFANLRLLYTYMFGHPGKKLLFMGCEFGQWDEWNDAKSLDWHLLQWESHQGIKRLVADLNELYTSHPSLYEVDYSWEGFEWINMTDAENSILSFIRYSRDKSEYLIFLANFTPNVIEDYKFGAPKATSYKTIFNSDSEYYGGSNVGQDIIKAEEGEHHNKPAHFSITLPPLAGVILKPI